MERKRTNKMNDQMDDLMCEYERKWVRIEDWDGNTYEGHIDDYIDRADTDRWIDVDDDTEIAFSCILVSLDDQHGTFFYEDEIKRLELLDVDEYEESGSDEG